MNYGAALVGEDEGRLVPQAEVVIIHSEPTYRPGPGRDVVRTRHVGEWRLAMSPAKMRQVAEALVKSADDLEAAFAGAVSRLALKAFDVEERKPEEDTAEER